MAALLLKPYILAYRESLHASAEQMTKPLDVAVSATFKFKDFPDVRDVIIRAGVSIEHQLSKLSIGFGEDTNVEDFKAISSLIYTPADSMYKAIQVAKQCAVTTLFQECLEEHGRQVERALDIYVESMLTLMEDGTFKIPVKSTGIVWDACKNLNNIPDTNTYCVKKRILQNVRLVADTVEEFKSIAEGGTIGWDDVEGDFDDEDEDGDGDDDDHKDAIDEDDTCRITTTVSLLQGLGKVLTICGGKVMKDLPTIEITREEVAQLDLLVVAVASVVKAISDLSCHLYPPHDTGLISASIPALTTALEELSDKLKVDFVGDETRVSLENGFTAIRKLMGTLSSQCIASDE